MKYLFLATFLFFSCSNKDAEQAKKLEDETVKIHDDVMPITFKVRDLRDSVLKKAEIASDSTLMDEGVSITNEMQEADTAMDEFMNKLGDAMNAKNTPEQKIKIFNDLKLQGQNVKKITLDAKQKAENYLKK